MTAADWKELTDFFGAIVPILTAVSLAISIAVLMRGWSVVKAIFNRVKLGHDFDMAKQQNQEKDIAIADLKQIAEVAKFASDSYLAEMNRLNARMKHLEEQVEELSQKLDMAICRYELSIGYIAAGDLNAPIPDAISEDVHKAKIRRQA